MNPLPRLRMTGNQGYPGKTISVAPISIVRAVLKRSSVSTCAVLFGIMFLGRDCPAQELWSASALAPAPPNGVLLFAGQFTTVDITRSLIPTAPHETNYLAGGAYERDFFQRWGFALGTEIGGAERFGMGRSFEGWAGLNVRYTAFVFLNTVRIIPGITVGFSAITRPVGIEAEREAAAQGNATLLGYLAPELAVSFVNFPNLEFVYRLQHRSGAGGTFGKLSDTANANVFGLRFRF
jgi:hypothetical protein